METVVLQPGNVQRFAVCGKDKKTWFCYAFRGGDTNGFSTNWKIYSRT